MLTFTKDQLSSKEAWERLNESRRRVKYIEVRYVAPGDVIAIAKYWGWDIEPNSGWCYSAKKSKESSRIGYAPEIISWALKNSNVSILKSGTLQIKGRSRSGMSRTALLSHALNTDRPWRVKVLGLQNRAFSDFYRAIAFCQKGVSK